MTRPVLSILCFASLSTTHARDIAVADAAEFAKLMKGEINPGDTFVLAAGEWADAALKLHALGTSDQPVTIKAQTPGATVLMGKSRLSISGSHVVVEGLHFKNPTGEEAIEFRTKSNVLATDCRVNDCAVTNDQAASKDGPTARFASIYGARNRVDHCLFEGKTTPGTTMVVWLSNDAKEQGRHRIDHNYFGPRPRLGKNGGETIRLGDSSTSMQRAECLVENNVFERCDGEAECISNKSCGNLYQHNTFLSVSGTLTLRHGNDCTVRENAFLGQKAKGSGGIRVIGENHRVLNNYLEGLRGDEERSALCFMLGIPDSKPFGYFQVKNARIEGNVITECATPMVIGVKGDSKASLPPIGTVLIGNVIHAPDATAIDARCDISGFEWQKNTVEAKSLGIPVVNGIDQSKATVAKPNDITLREGVGPLWKK